jgi:ABC-type multidrug transport system permease subunit
MIINKFLQIIMKNFRVLIRSKASALIVIVGPLLVILLLGLAFDNTNAYALNIGVYAESYTDVITSFVDKLSEKHFNVVKVNYEDDCMQKIKDGSLHACIVFPPGFSIKGEDRKNEITFYVDYSRVNIVYIILETLTNKISMRSKEISMELTNTLLTSLESTRAEIFSKKPLISRLTSGNSAMSSNVNKVIIDLGTLDLSLDTTEFKIDDIKDALSSSNRSSAVNKIDSARSKVNTAKGMAEGLEGGGDIVNDLDSAYSYLTDARSLLAVGNVSASLSLVDQCYAKIMDAKERMTDAAIISDSSVKLLKSVKTALNDSSSSVQELQTSFEKIDNYIGSVQVSGADEVVSPIKTGIKAVTSDTTHLNLLFPSLIVLVVMFVSILLSSTFVMMEKHSPAYFRNFITPASDFIFVISTYFTSMVLVLLQIIIILLISASFFSTDILTSALEAAIALVLITSAFTFLGMLIGHLFTSEETGTLAAISLGSMFLLLSNLFTPLESVPESLRVILSYNPFVVAESLLKKVIIFHQPLVSSQQSVYYFIAVSLVLFLIIMLISVIGRRNLLHGWGSISPGKTRMSFLPSFLKRSPKNKPETKEEKESKEKQKKFSLKKVETSKIKTTPSKLKEVGFFKYLR